MRITVKKIAVAGVLSAVVMVLGITRLGFIPLPAGASLTILQVPVIIGAVAEGPFVGFFIGLLFGIFSIIMAALSATSVIDMAFVNYPFIALIPRVLIGPAAWLFYAFITGKFGEKEESLEEKTPVWRETTGIIAAGLIGSLVNTVLVLAGLGFLKVVPWELIFFVAATNGSLEAAASAILTFMVVTAWKQIPIGQGKSRLSKSAEKLE